jgi:hypothetical protein
LYYKYSIAASNVQQNEIANKIEYMTNIQGCRTEYNPAKVGPYFLSYKINFPS